MSNFSDDLKTLWYHYSAFFIIGILILILGGMAFFAPTIISRMSGETRFAENVDEEDSPEVAARTPRVTARPTSRSVEVRGLQDLLFLHHDAMGGRQAIERINALRLSGVLSQEGDETEFVIIKKKPRQVRMNISTPTVRQSYIFDGRNGQVEITTAQGSEIVPMTEEQLRNFELDSEIFTPVSDPAQALTNLSFEGLVDYMDDRFYRIAYRRSDYVQDYYYINPDTYLIDYMHRIRDDERGKREEFYHYIEYRQVEGVPIAFQIRQRITGAQETEFHVKFNQVEWNPGLLGNLFRLRTP
jgi:hypothetical protein